MKITELYQAIKRNFGHALGFSLGSSDPIQATLQGVRQEMINSIWTGLFILVTVGVPISVSRSLLTGWMPMYSIHLVVGLIVCISFVNRRHIPYLASLTLICTLFWVIGIAGTFTLGLYGAGIWWMSLGALLVSMLISVRAGLICVALSTAIIMVAGNNFINGTLEIPFDANAYIRDPSAWITLLVGTTAMPVIVFVAAAKYQVATVRLASKIEEQRQEIEHLATHDHLTGLPSAKLARDRLEHALARHSRQSKKIALLFLDLDGFKAVNDTYGHDAGDEVLIVVAERMRCRFRAEDTISRKGGDEFLLILEEVRDAQAAMSLATQLTALISEPIPYEGNKLIVGASIGVAIAPDNAIDAFELTKLADTAMYEAKRAGKNTARLAPLHSEIAGAPDMS
ncbi:MAG: diguanylate cyclase domain-containing protein [Oceanococcus sp.]